MANELRSGPVSFVGQVNEYLRDQGQSHHFPSHGQSPYPPPEPPAGEHSEADVASILGLPQEALTPEVMERVTHLLAEMDRLRWFDEQHRRRQAFLEALADGDCVAPLLNRRGFMRALESWLAGGGEGVVAVLHVHGIEDLRQRHGLAAGEAALRHVAVHLVGQLRGSDPVGLLGGSDFAVLLTVTGLDAAREKMRSVMETINRENFVWGGSPMGFPMFSGYRELTVADGAEAVVAAADRARRGLS